MAPVLFEGAEGSAQAAALGGGGFGELGGEAAALAVVGLGEVDEFEVEAEGAGELVGGGDVEGVDVLEGLLEVMGGVDGVGSSASRRAMAVRRRASTAA